MHQVAEALVVVHSVAHHEFVRDEEPDVFSEVVELDILGCLFMESDASFNFCGANDQGSN